MKFVKNDLSAEFGQIEIELFFDVHIGSPKCDYKYLRERIKYVQEHENVFAIIGGDLINNSTRNSVGDVYEEPLTPMQQIKTAVSTFEPIKDKILCAVSGNHENRSYKSDGIDLLHFFCAELGITDKYDSTACLSFVRFGNAKSKTPRLHSGRKLCYSIYVTHGDGQGGRTIGGKANGLQKRGKVIDADVIVTGHTHSGMAFRDSMYRVDPQNSSAFLKEQVFVNAGSFLNYESYAERYGLPPSSKLSPRIILSGTEKQIATIY